MMSFSSSQALTVPSGTRTFTREEMTANGTRKMLFRAALKTLLGQYNLYWIEGKLRLKDIKSLDNILFVGGRAGI